jgi:transposase InsO family protein
VKASAEVWSYHSNHSQQEAFMTHANATLTPKGRLQLARLVVDKRWPLARAAERHSVRAGTAKRWADRYREALRIGADPLAAMRDRSSRPRRCPRRLPTRVERRIIGLRVSRRWGPARIAWHLGLNPATVHKVLTRYRCPRLTWTDPVTGTRIKAAPRRSYEHDAPGDLVHLDIKKLGKIPPGGGHRVLGRAAGQKNTSRGRIGYWYIHNAVDDHSRYTYSELLTDEKKETAAAFWTRARAHFADLGISVTAVLTDNGSCYRSAAFTAALGEDIKHRRTRPYRPQTNGKVERVNRTMLEEWAYARAYRSEDERAAAFATWLHTYNHHRPHSSLKGLSPADRVPNLSGSNS